MHGTKSDSSHPTLETALPPRAPPDAGSSRPPRPLADILGLEASELAGLGPNSGLDTAEAAARLVRWGPNELPEPRTEGWFRRAFRQLREPMALLLIVAALVAGLALRERLDMAAILAIVLLNAAIGVLQEGKAASALQSLRTLETPRSRVRRSGAVADLPSREVVPGDVVLLAAGDRVPADLRLVAATSLEIDESLLTGESLPVSKDLLMQETSSLHDQPSMAFSGTLVTRGTGEGVAIATGPHTQIGSIARHLLEPESSTPLQRELGRLSARLGVVSAVVAAAVFGLIMMRVGLTHQGIERAFLSAVALAVAAIPEGLATVVAVGLALGVRRMASRGAIVRRLPAVETLGSTTVILTDKTGTLTENRMWVETVARPKASGGGLATAADAPADAHIVAALCNDASLDPPSGDPLEVALLEWVGADRVAELRKSAPRLAAEPFDSASKRMLTLNRVASSLMLLAKGAPEAILGICDGARTCNGTVEPLDEALRLRLLGLADAMARTGARVLALAAREPAGRPIDLADEARGLTLVGLAALRDPIRSEASSAVALARVAGIRLVMVTGDHAGTALDVGRRVGLADSGDAFITGAALRADGPPEDPASMPVYARMEPDQKLLLVETLQHRGEVVAVTGDGVNDAPALRKADIGVAMGRSGSDVAREAADMVITDDNLATIVEAVREGRGIYDNIRKVVDYLIAGNLSEIMVVVSCLLLFPGLGVPLLPLQLLWINLLTDGPPAIALGVDPTDPGIMSRPPGQRGRRLLDARRLSMLAARGALIACSAVAALAVARFVWGEPWTHARAVMFTVLMTAHLLYAFIARHPNRGLASNRWLLLAVGGGILLQLAIVTWPPVRELFGTTSLTLREWALVAVAGIAPIAAMRAWSGQPRNGVTPEEGPSARWARDLGPTGIDRSTEMLASPNPVVIAAGGRGG